MTVELALYKGEGQLGNAAIRLWTGRIHSHCELVVGDWCYSSSVMDKGVRRKQVGLGAEQISLSASNWDRILLPWADGDSIIQYFEATDGDTYGWPSLIFNQVFNRNIPTEHAAFCSEWDARALGLPNASIYNPGTLGDQCRWLTDVWYAGGHIPKKY